MQEMRTDFDFNWYDEVSKKCDYEYLSRRLFELSKEFNNSSFSLVKVSIDKKENCYEYAVKLYFSIGKGGAYNAVCTINSDGLSCMFLDIGVNNSITMPIGTGLTPLSSLEAFLFEAQDLIFEHFRERYI